MSQALPYLAGFLITLLVVFYVYSSAVATWHLGHATYFTRFQKLAQLAIIWLLPVFGVAIVLHMLGPEVRKRRPGWVPLLEPLVLAVFIQSASSTTDSGSNDGASLDSTPSSDGAGDGGAD
jgi:hypothetical protein